MKSLKILTIALLAGLFMFASQATFAQSGKIAGDKEPATIKMKQEQRAASQAKIAAQRAERIQAMRAKAAAKGVETKAVNPEKKEALKAKIAAKRAAQMQKASDRGDQFAAFKAQREAARNAARQSLQRPTRQERMKTLFENRD